MGTYYTPSGRSFGACGTRPLQVRLGDEDDVGELELLLFRSQLPPRVVGQSPDPGVSHPVSDVHMPPPNVLRQRLRIDRNGDLPARVDLLDLTGETAIMAVEEPGL